MRLKVCVCSTARVDTAGDISTLEIVPSCPWRDSLKKHTIFIFSEKESEYFLIQVMFFFSRHLHNNQMHVTNWICVFYTYNDGNMCPFLIDHNLWECDQATSVFKCTRIYKYVYMQKCMYTYIYTYTNTYICIYTRTYICIYTYIYMYYSIHVERSGPGLSLVFMSWQVVVSNDHWELIIHFFSTKHLLSNGVFSPWVPPLLGVTSNIK